MYLCLREGVVCCCFCGGGGVDMRSKRVIFDVSDMVDMNLSCSSDESV